MLHQQCKNLKKYGKKLFQMLFSFTRLPQLSIFIFVEAQGKTYCNCSSASRRIPFFHWMAWYDNETPCVCAMWNHKLPVANKMSHCSRRIANEKRDVKS